MRTRAPLPLRDLLARVFRDSHIATGVSRHADGRFVAVNRAFLRLFGRRRRDVIGHTSLELGLWPIPEERAQMVAAMRESGAVSGFEARFRTRDGAIGDLLISANIVEVEGEKYMVGQLIDVSGRRRTEAALRMEAMRLNTALRVSELTIWHQDRDLRYTWIANPGLGASTKTLLGRSDADVLGRQAARQLTTVKRRVLATGRGERSEVWLTMGERSGCYDLIVEPERDASGRLAGVVCASVDITTRKRAEEHLQLQASILEKLEEGVNLVDAKGVLRYTNPRFDAMFGYAPGELVGQPVSVLNAPTAKGSESTARAILRALKRDGRWRGEIRNRRKDGSEFWSFGTIAAVRHPQFGAVWVSVQSDVTALHEAQEQRDEAFRALGLLSDRIQDEIEAQRRELAREVHDEIGAVLTGLRMRLDASRGSPGRDELVALRSLVDRALDRTRALCSQLRPPMLDDLGLAETLRWYVREWAESSGIAARVRIGALDGEPADPLRTDLFRIAQELLTNVARHAAARRVGVSLLHARGTLRLTVRDDGRGFAELQERGLGLLGIAERLRRHGGTLRIASGRGGTTATVTVPERAR